MHVLVLYIEKIIPSQSEEVKEKMQYIAKNLASLPYIEVFRPFKEQIFSHSIFPL
jgi:hypothetical protein